MNAKQNASITVIPGDGSPTREGQPREDQPRGGRLRGGAAPEKRKLPLGDAETVLDLLRDAGITVAAPCGGSGTCGKCLVRLDVGVGVGELPPPGPMELRLVSRKQLDQGYRFACTLVPRDGLVVHVPVWQGSTKNKSAPVRQRLENDPAITKVMIQAPSPTIDDQRPDLERILDQLDNPHVSITPDGLRALSDAVRTGGYQITAVVALDEGNERSLLGVEPGDTTDVLWGVAVDVGTTTVAAYLVDLVHGHTVDAHSELNRQAEFGADVVSRISYSQRKGVEPVHRVIVSQINEIILTLTGRNNLAPESVYRVLLAGNTTMSHFFAGLDPAGIGVSPFIPVTSRKITMRPGDSGIGINGAGRVELLPAISGYVGADIVAAIEASRMRETAGVSLLIDIGTNGEIVLGNREWLVACSTAAGPAFEGAQIRFGVGGIEGAVNTFAMEDEEPVYTTINSGAATGICGSGMLDIVAVLLEAGVVDETGRLLPARELPEGLPEAIRGRCHDFEDHPAFLVVPREETLRGEAIYLTEQDVRELQLAKAAIAAGIDTLLVESGIEAASLDRVYLAGGFGSYLDAGSALTVGLLPREAQDKVQVLGNAAGIGAVMALASRRVSAECDLLSRNVRYVELSSSAAFQMAYIERMTFGG